MASDMSESRIHVGDLKPGDIALLKDVAEQAAELAVKRTFITLGMDPEKPIAAQRDFAWVRATRERSEGLWGKIILSLVGIGVVGATSAFWIGFQNLVGKGPHP